ncbi:MAG: hypothetical protein ACLGG1_02830, partial [Gammaproteobacteria bacterium]
MPAPTSIPHREGVTIRGQQSSFTRAELLACARGELFGTNAARLPDSQMLLVDRITHIDSTGGTHGKGHVIAELDIRPDLWFFGCHF